MTDRPAYIVHHVDEDEVTVDWFFGDRRFGEKLGQLVLILVGWFFAILPVVITASSLLHRYDAGGWWNYTEGFVMWDRTMAALGFLFVVFVVGFLVLYLVNRSAAKQHARQKTYDEQRLALRLEVAAEWYADKFGPEELRLQRTTVEIEPYSDLETYELRRRFRTYGVD